MLEEREKDVCHSHLTIYANIAQLKGEEAPDRWVHLEAGGQLLG